MITILDRPNSFTRSGQRLIFTAESTLVGNTNFRYVVKITDVFNSLDTTHLVQPNYSNKLMFDISHAVRPHVHGALTFAAGEVAQQSGLFYNTSLQTFWKVEIGEGWDIAGTFTVDTGSFIDATDYSGCPNLCLIPGAYTLSDGYKKAPTEYVLNGTTSTLMTDRRHGMHRPDTFKYGLNTNNTIVYIPVEDWEQGVIAFTAQGWGADDNYIASTTENVRARMQLFTSTGTPISAVSPTDVFDTGVQVVTLGCYPATLNNSEELVILTDYPNWRWYDIWLVANNGTTRISNIYRFYRIERPCDERYVQLQWFNDRLGGFEQFTYRLVSESKSGEFIEYETSPDAWGGAAFGQVAEEFTRTKKAKKTADRIWTLDTGSLEEAEYKYAISVITSSSVFMLVPGLTFPLPVMIDASTASAPTRNGVKRQRGQITVKEINI